MMRFTYLINILVAGGLLLQGGGSPQGQSVQDSLDDTVSALRTLGKIQQQLADGDASGIELIMAATEAPIPDAQQRDEFLVSLRSEVGRLHMSLDQTFLTGPTMPVSQEVVPPTPPSDGAQHTTRAPTTGINPSLREALGAKKPPLGQLSPTAVNSRTKARAFESPGFSADLVYQGRLYYRAGRYPEAITLLGATDEPEATYWLARCLENLERDAEAIEHYRTVVNHPNAGAFADRAGRDLKFLEWKQDFIERRKARDEG